MGEDLSLLKDASIDMCYDYTLIYDALRAHMLEWKNENPFN